MNLRLKPARLRDSYAREAQLLNDASCYCSGRPLSFNPRTDARAFLKQLGSEVAFLAIPVTGKVVTWRTSRTPGAGAAFHSSLGTGCP